MLSTSSILGLTADPVVTESESNLQNGLSDHTLMLAVRDGDIALLGELFERHHGRLFGFFARLTQDRHASDDLVQRVFQRILCFRHTYRDNGSFVAWFYHIARSILSDHCRHTSATNRRVEYESDLSEVPDSVPDAASTAATSDETRLLHLAMAALSADEREILVLARFQELHYDEIARVLGISVGAVKVRVHRALRKLREVYLRLERDPIRATKTQPHPGGDKQ